MRTKKPSIRFWTLLGAINVLAALYPVHLVRQADTAPDSFLAGAVLIVLVFLLVIADAISIMIAYFAAGSFDL